MTVTDPVAQVLQLVKNSADDWDETSAKFCSEDCIKRYLRARNGDVGKASKMLHDTLKWRKERRIDEMTLQAVEEDLKGGLIYYGGTDEQGHAIVVTRKRSTPLPADQMDGYIRNLIFVLESAIRGMKGGAQQWVFMMDMANYSRANSPPLSVTMSTLRMLQDHYPERMYKAYIVNAPSMFEMFWALVSPVLDSVTRSKVEFVRTKDATKTTACSSSSSFSSFASSWGLTGWVARRDSHPPADVTADASVDTTAVISESAADSKLPHLSCNVPSFQPLLGLYSTPYEHSAQTQLLRTLGW